MITEDALEPHAMWTDDCQGKKDFDGDFIRISTRYWPGPEGGGTMTVIADAGRAPVFGTVPYGPRPSAHSSIIMPYGRATEHDGGGDYLIWRDKHFEADTEAEVKAQVEAWGKEQMLEVVKLLGGLLAFREWSAT